MSGHPRTHQNAILRTYAGLLLISICVYTLMYAPQPMFFSASALYRRCWFRWCSQPSCPALPSCSATWISTVRLRAM